MKQELIDQLLKVRDDTYATAVRTVFAAGTEHYSVMDQATVEKMIEHNLPWFGMTPEGKRLIEALKKAPDTRFEYYRQRLSRDALAYARKALGQGFKALPHGRGGRPGAFSDDQKREVCEAVVQLIQGGMSEPAAIAEVARLRDVSVKTVRRTWKDRRTLLAKFDTHSFDSPDGVKPTSRKRPRKSAKI